MYTAKCGNNVSKMLVVVDDNFHVDRLIDRLEGPAIHVTVPRVLLVGQVERLGLAGALRLDVEAHIRGIVEHALEEGALTTVREIGRLDREDLVRPITDGRDLLGVLAAELEMDGGVSDVEDDVVHIVNIHLIEADVHS